MSQQILSASVATGEERIAWNGLVFFAFYGELHLDLKAVIVETLARRKTFFNKSVHDVLTY
jgi:hypothetical protein